ncbi:hypothetical protein IWX49DRAFT_565412 [Phyllosticta citricarpa]
MMGGHRKRWFDSTASRIIRGRLRSLLLLPLLLPLIQGLSLLSCLFESCISDCLRCAPSSFSPWRNLPIIIRLFCCSSPAGSRRLFVPSLPHPID